MGALKADRRLCVTADRSQIVEENDPRAKWLLAAVGRTIGPGDVERYGLSEKGGRVHYKGAPDLEPIVKQAETPEDKQAEIGENKATRLGPDRSEPAMETAEAEQETRVPEWTLKTPPEEYLEKHPDGPNADLAREIVAAQVDPDEDDAGGS